jgi:serine/threonine-protein kinase
LGIARIERASVDDRLIGETVGNFVLESQLGKGGMGAVYRARHRELDTHAAVKILDERISEDRDHVQRFFNEARIVSRIRHAGTIKIFDCGFVKGNAYLVMELLEGESLARRLLRGRLAVTAAVDIGRQIASVLDATHRSGVIHRDLKPDNIFITPDDERQTGERVKVLDFGIAKLSGTLASGSPQTIGTMGTPQYMAPEQWRDTAQVDWYADAYSLGCVMFEMCCGRTPFIAKTIPEAYARHAEDPVPQPRTFVPSLPDALDMLVVRLLQKQPAARAKSMADVVRELDAIAAAPKPEGATAPTLAAEPASAAARTLATVAPGMTSTTLGGTAAEVATRAPQKRSRAALAAAGIAAIAVALGVFAVTRDGPASEPASVPAAVHDAAVMTATPDAALPDAGIDTPLDAAPPPDAAKRSSRPPTVPKRRDAGVAEPQSTGTDDDFGGRR